MGFFKYVCFFILFLTPTLGAIEVNGNSSNISLLERASIYFDAEGRHSKEQLKPSYFQPNNDATLLYGFQPKAVLWIQFTLRNVTDQSLSKTLVYEDTVTDHLRIYFDGQEIIEGKFFIPEERTTLYPSFDVTLEPYETKEILIKAYSPHSSLIAQLTLCDPNTFISRDHERKNYLFAFFAVMAILFVYNLFIWIFTKDRAYLYYLIYLGSLIFFEGNYLTVSHLYLFSPQTSEIITQNNMLYIALMIVSIVLFTREFLGTQRFKRLDTLLKLYIYLPFPVALLSCNNVVLNMNAISLFIPAAFIVIFTAYYAFFSGIPQAKYYMIGWSFVVIALLFINLQTLGVYDIYAHFPYLNELAFVFEALLFSIALAHRIELLKRAKQTSDEKLIRFQQEEQQRLEILVAQKTQELSHSLEEKKLLYQELNHRVKNNIQMILSLLSLQIINTDSNETKEELTYAQNRINTMLGLYDKLYLDQKSNRIDTGAYLKEIIQTVQESFEHLKITIDLTVNHALHDEQLVYCGLIVNELVTNSFKYAFTPTDSGHITIQLDKKGDTVHLTVKDNGIGLQAYTPHSLGHTIVEALVVKQLLGTMRIRNHHGTEITIQWEEKE